MNQYCPQSDVYDRNSINRAKLILITSELKEIKSSYERKSAVRKYLNNALYGISGAISSLERIIENENGSLS